VPKTRRRKGRRMVRRQMRMRYGRMAAVLMMQTQREVETRPEVEQM